MKNGSYKYFLSVSKFQERAAFIRRLLFLFFSQSSLIIIFLFFACSNILFSQNTNLSVSIKGNYTSSSRYYPAYGITSSPYVTDTYENYYSIDDLLGFGVEFRYSLSENLKIGLSGEYVSGVKEYSVNRFITIIPAKSAYDMYILEADIYYYIPLSGERFKFYIGGGTNMAKADSYDQIADLKTELISAPVNIGIQALSGLEFFFFDNFSVRWEMKFRDPIVENEQSYKESKISYLGRTYSISSNKYTTKVNLNGLVFELGLAYHLF